MIVEPRHFEYLAVQRGGISDKRHDFKDWKLAYDRAIEDDYISMLPALPATARWVLDVGGGLSGITARLNQHYGGINVAVLDSKAQPPKVKRHAVPYNNATVTQQFLRKNGVQNQIFWDAENLDRDAFRGGPRYDIVLSTQAWCFHFEPEEYLSLIEDQISVGTVVILDVRRDKEGWMETLLDAFGTAHLLYSAAKWTRCAWTII